MLYYELTFKSMNEFKLNKVKPRETCAELCIFELIAKCRNYVLLP